MEKTPGGVPISDLDPFTVEAIRDAQAFDGSLREMAPVVYLPQYDIWVVGRHAEVHSVAGDGATIRIRRGRSMIPTRYVQKFC